MKSEEEKAVDEEIRLEEERAAFREAFIGHCWSPEECDQGMMPVSCELCLWDGDKEFDRIKTYLGSAGKLPK